MCIVQYILHIYIQIANIIVYNSHDNNHYTSRYILANNNFLIYFKYINPEFFIVKRRWYFIPSNHNGDELLFSYRYTMQCVIAWCNLTEVVLRKSIVFVLSCMLFRKR